MTASMSNRQELEPRMFGVSRSPYATRCLVGLKEIQEYMVVEADRCLQAKERMMEAETDEAFEVAMRRVEFFCDD